MTELMARARTLMGVKDYLSTGAKGIAKVAVIRMNWKKTARTLGSEETKEAKPLTVAPS